MKEQSEAVYLRLARQLAIEIESGLLLPGERLQPERVLCDRWSCSRDTVKCVLTQLRRAGLLETRRGSGSYVAGGASKQKLSDLEQSVAQLAEHAKQQGFSPREGKWFLSAHAWETLPARERVRLAWVDDCPELLAANCAALEQSCKVAATAFSSGDLPHQTFALMATPFEQKERVRQALTRAGWKGTPPLLLTAQLLSLQTVGQLSALPSNARVAVVYQSAGYQQRVEAQLQALHLNLAFAYLPIVKEDAHFFSTLEDYDAVLMPPCYPREDLVREKETHARWISFSLLVDAGSCAHITQQAQQLWLTQSAQWLERQG